MYLTEDEMFNDFDNEAALVWKKTGLVYGDWTSGTNRDGSFEKFIEFDTPTVGNFGDTECIYLLELA